MVERLTVRTEEVRALAAVPDRQPRLVRCRRNRGAFIPWLRSRGTIPRGLIRGVSE